MENKSNKIEVEDVSGYCKFEFNKHEWDNIPKVISKYSIHLE